MQSEIVDSKTEQKLQELMEDELDAMSLIYPNHEVNQELMILLNRRLYERGINELLPDHVVFAGVQLYDQNKVKILLKRMDS